MKKIAILLLIISGLLFFVFNDEKESNDSTQNENVLGEVTDENIEELFVGQEKYKASYYEVSALNLSLFSNFEDRLTAREALREKECEALVTGGFHSSEEGPLGLFISEGNLVSQSKQSSLLNGYFFVNEGEAGISDDAPEDALLAVQAGPLFFRNDNAVDVRAGNSENARRVVAATTKRDTVLFVVFYEEDNYIRGPKLREVPELLNSLSENIGVSIDSAINLDGGSHSSFTTPFITLPEISPIGSYFCIR